MAIYGTPITMGGGGGSNDTLPPLLDNFKATRLEGGIVPPTANTLAFKDIPDGAKIKLVKGSNISATVTYGTTTDLNHRIVFDSNDWTRKQFYLENDVDQASIYFSDIDQWLNSTKASGWWTKARQPYAGEIDPYPTTNTTPPDYANEQGFLYQLGITDEVLAQNFNDININATEKNKVGIPWQSKFDGIRNIPYTFFQNYTGDSVTHDYGYLYRERGDMVDTYFKGQVRAPSPITIQQIPIKIHPMMEPKPETKVALDVDGSYFMFENQAGGIVLSADKMEESRAKDLAGAVWVYSDHIPQNKNDGTKIELARDEVIKPDAVQTLATGKTIADLPSKSKVKLGRYGDADLQWLVSRNAENKLFLILAAESMSVLETKMFDNAEPSNPNGDRASNGNNKYSLSNIHQWLNSDKSANSWYTKSHTYDASPDYTNLDGFLAKWTNAELQAVLNTTWTTTTAEVDGDNTETFQSKITLPSTTEMNLESNTGGSKLDIFDSNEDRTIAGKYYWCRTPFPSKPSGERMVDIKGELSAILVNQTTVGVRPICSILETTLVSDTPDSDGCYTFIFTPPLERTVAWDKSKNFYARQFTYNSKKQYQTMLEGATAELLLGEVPLPVSNLTISENAGASPTLSWKNPADKNYHETVVVQKEGSTPPRSTDDGIEVYRGAGESVTVKDLQSTVDYSFGVFTLSPYGNYGEPSTISYRYDFPSEPTSYTKLSEISESTTWKLPENGYFLICAVGKSGDGGKGVSIDAAGNATGVKSCSIAGGGSGGTGSFSERLISGHKGDEYILTITNAETKVERLGETIIHARAGGNGSDARADSRRDVYQGTGGAPGTSLQVDGSQIQNGGFGQAGEKWQYSSSDTDNPWKVQGGRSATRTYNSSVAIAESCSTSSGQGGDGNPIYQEGTYYTPGGTGTHGQIIIYRGNTNTPSPQ